MHFQPTISVMINGQQLNYVSSVKTKAESSHIGSECEIKVPQNTVVVYKGAGKKNILSQYQPIPISVGDSVSITAQYDGYPTVTIFQGFVFDFVEDMPTTIKCLDWVYQLNLNMVNSLSFPGTSRFSTVVDAILANTGVSQLTGNIDFDLYNISFKLMSPAAMLETFKKDIGLNISLQGNQLYANIASNTLDDVQYDTTVNVIKSGMQKPETAFQQFQVTAHFVLPNAKKSTIQVGSGVNQDKWFYPLAYNPALFQQLAEQALIKAKQQHYSGSLTTFLYPDIKLYDKATYSDYQYPDKNGDYVCIGHEFDIGDGGFRRKVKLAYLDNSTATAA